ncbi:MAG: hypothetical protein PUF62_04255 [Bacteroidales bacterium]|nr:hypothetical protein [Bacteroidales bacterium]
MVGRLYLYAGFEEKPTMARITPINSIRDISGKQTQVSFLKNMDIPLLNPKKVVHLLNLL